MFQYIYKPSDIGLDSWPSGELRLEGFDVTENPAEADVFVCPGNLSNLIFDDETKTIHRDRFNRLPYFVGNESRHCFFDVSDNFKESIGLPCLFIKCDARSWMIKGDPGTINLAWPVEDYAAECMAVPEGGLKYDVSGHMWSSTQTRIDSAQSCLNNPLLKSDIALYPDFTGYLHDRTTNEWTPEGIRRRAEFRRSMKESRIALCPESIPGVFPYRFFEAMSAGRVPLLVSSDYVFPWSESIPYKDFCLFCERADAASADRVALDFIRSHSDEQTIAMGSMARHFWEKYLNRDDWPRTMAIAVARKLAELK